MDKAETVIFTDGACEPNPGYGGWAFVAFSENGKTRSHHEIGGARGTTNNIMEMTAVLRAIEWATASSRSPSSFVIKSDSQYVVNGCTSWMKSWKKKNWMLGKNRPVKNLEIWKQIDSALESFPCRIEWVRGHNGTHGNELADSLADHGRSAYLPF